MSQLKPVSRECVSRKLDTAHSSSAVEAPSSGTEPAAAPRLSFVFDHQRGLGRCQMTRANGRPCQGHGCAVVRGRVVCRMHKKVRI